MRAHVLPGMGSTTQDSLGPLAISGPVINGTQTYLGTAPSRGRLVDGDGNDIVASASGGRQNVALIQARAFFNSIGLQSSYPQTLSAGDTPASYVPAPQGRARTTYTSDGSAATITADGNVGDRDGDRCPQPTSDNPYGDVPQTLTLGRSGKDVEALTPTQVAALTNDQVRDLTQSQIRALSAAQIQALNKRELWDLTGDQIGAFTADQVPPFAPGQLQSRNSGFWNHVDQRTSADR